MCLSASKSTQTSCRSAKKSSPAVGNLTIATTSIFRCNKPMRTLLSYIRLIRIPSLICAGVIATAFLAYTGATESFLRGQSKTSKSASAPQNSSKRNSSIVQEAGSDQFLWKVDLHPMGYPAENHMLQWQRGLGSFDTIDFLSDNIVAETFVTQEPAAGLQRRDDPNRARPYRLHAIFMDAATGSVLKTLEWLGDDLKMGIFPRYDGSFVFFSTDRLILYSPDWKPAKEVALVDSQEPGADFMEIAESPSGKFLEFRIRKGGALECLRVRTDTLTAERDTCTKLLPFIISDNGIASTFTPDAVRFGNENREDHRTVTRAENKIQMARTSIETVQFIGGRGDLMITLCSTPGLRSCGTPAFLTNNLMIVHGQYDLGLLDVTGLGEGGKAKLQFQREFAKTAIDNELPGIGHEWIATLGRPIRTSANGERFAVAMNAARTPTHNSTEHALLPETLPAIDPTHLDVYDVPSGNQKRIPDQQCDYDRPCDWWIYRLTNVKHQLQHIWGFGLSPNGEKLVIDSGGVLQMYALPPATHLTH
jgi:hypothetical protein